MDELESYDEKEKKGETEDEEEKRAKFQLISPLSQLHNIIVHIQGSTACTNEFLKLVGRKVPLDNCTRWNSWYLMLVIAVEKAGAIDTYTKNHFPTLEADYLTPQHWNRLCIIKEFLQPFYQAILKT